jgi:Methylamine utilisation protein MauE
MSVQLEPLLHLAVTGFVVVVLTRAVIEKLLAYGSYVANVRDYQLLPDALASVVAPALLGAEIAAIFCLLLPALVTAGAVIATTLFAVYAAAMAAVLLAGRTEIECGCGGDGQIVTWALVARNGVLIALAGAGVLHTSARPMNWLETLVGSSAVLVGFLLLAIAEKTIGTALAIRRLNSGSNTRG